MWVAPLLVLPVHASSGDKVVRTKEDVKGLGAGRGQNSYSLRSAFIYRVMHECIEHLVSSLRSFIILTKCSCRLSIQIA